jgi:hypothetical protein
VDKVLYLFKLFRFLRLALSSSESFRADTNRPGWLPKWFELPAISSSYPQTVRVTRNQFNSFRIFSRESVRIGHFPALALNNNNPILCRLARSAHHD